jgi:16S rRNA (guanine527-N7)-methyltransferase
MSSLSRAQIETALEPYCIVPSVELLERIRAYIPLLLKWNQSVSLTAITDIDQILRFHFGESLFALSMLPVEKSRLADVGSGAGFPGIPLAMASPSSNVTLIESNAKKFAFLSQVIRELRLKNAFALRCRMEDVKGPDRLFDLITARALGQFKPLLRWSRERLTPSGRIALWLGEDDVSEVSSEPGWEWRTATAIPGSERRFILSGSSRSEISG